MTLPRAEELIRKKMQLRGVPEAAVASFLDKVRQTGKEASHVPLDSVSRPDPTRILDLGPNSPRMAELEAQGESLLGHVAVIKLNGGRSTTMGGRIPKGVLYAKDGRSYLEIIIGQVRADRKRYGKDIPLILMNSFFTHEPTMKLIQDCDIPIFTFQQNQVPRLVLPTMQPLDTGSDEDWAPPGHGDVYESLKRSGLLDKLLHNGFRWAFISNLDNLAACVEPWIVGLLDAERIDFLLEVTDRTLADRKGGTLVIRDGKLDLLEIAQVSRDNREEFMDIERFKVFNTNNLWVDLAALSRALDRRALRLPLIQNRKTVASVDIVQLETAMGAAIGCFNRARGLRVGRERFFPTKKIADLFVIQSDACVLDSGDRLKRNPLRPAGLPWMPWVFFDPDFLSAPDEIPEHFEDISSISLLMAESLEVFGNVFFEPDVTIQGKVKISRPPGSRRFVVPRGTVLSDCTCQ